MFYSEYFGEQIDELVLGRVSWDKVLILKVRRTKKTTLAFFNSLLVIVFKIIYLFGCVGS